MSKFIVKWGIYAKPFDDIESAIGFAHKKIATDESFYVRVVRERYEQREGGTLAKLETTYYSAVRPISPVEIEV